MSIPHRLNAGNRFERPETQSIKRVVFLSVEGEVTERRYFEFVRESRETLGIKSVVEIHVLRRGDSSSSPEKVVELLENYLRFLYKGIIIKHNKTEPTYTKTSLFLCEKRRFFMARTEKGVVTTI